MATRASFFKRALAALVLKVLRVVFGPARCTSLDVYFAYRLLLLRNPDPDGWRHHLGAVRRGEMSLEGLSNTLLASDEFRQRRELPGHQDDYQRKPVQEEVVDAYGLKFAIDTNDLVIGRAIRDEVYEPASLAIVQSLLSSGGVMADIGANIGLFTVIASRCVGDSGSVWAFEPIEHNFRLLEKSVELNQLRNVKLFRVALIERAAEIEFLQWERRNSGSFHILNEDRAWEGARYSVQGQRFDDLFVGERLDLVKIDVEGAEGRVLDGMRQALERYRPTILFEYSPAALADISHRPGASILADLAALGYAFVEANAYVAGRRSMSVAQLTKEIRRRGANHLDIVAINQARS